MVRFDGTTSSFSRTQPLNISARMIDDARLPGERTSF
jgi:hypothetical protein